MTNQELLFSGEVLEGVQVSVSRTKTPEPQRASFSGQGMANHSRIPTYQSHGVLKAIDKTTGVYKKFSVIVDLTSEPEGPIDSKFFTTALIKKLHSEGDIKDHVLSMDQFVDFEFIQGLNGKFLGPFGEKCELLQQRGEPFEGYAYEIAVRGLHGVPMGGAYIPFASKLFLRTAIDPYDLAAALVNMEEMVDNVEKSVHQIVKQGVSDILGFEAIEFSQGSQQIAIITYGNNRKYAHSGGTLFNYPDVDKDHRLVWPAPDMCRQY